MERQGKYQFRVGGSQVSQKPENYVYFYGLSTFLCILPFSLVLVLSWPYIGGIMLLVIPNNNGLAEVSNMTICNCFFN